MTYRLIRGCLVVSPFLLGAVGCVGGPQVIQASGSTGSSSSSSSIGAIRYQKPADVVPASLGSLPPVTLADGNVAVRAVAYVNNAPIYENELRDAVNQAMGQHTKEYSSLDETERNAKRKEIEKQELDRLIERELILEIALAQLKKVRPKSIDELHKEAGKEFDKQMRKIKDTYKIETDEQLKEFIKSQGGSLDTMKRQSERWFIAMEYMRNIIFPKIQTIPMSDIREYYDTHPDEFMDQNRAKWQGIFLDATKFESREAAARYAEGTAARLRSGGDFLATANQLRQAGYNVQLSDVGVGEKAGEIRPAEIEAAVFRLKPGEVGPVIEMPGGFQIIRVAERNYAGRKPFSLEMQADIRKKVQSVCWDREFKAVVDEMKTKAVIQKVVP
jgi:parvulin-like peptidyl-prolyl isomerase